VNRASLLTPPNLLSLSRIPLAVAFVLASGAQARVALLGAASLTDLLDGWLARRRQVTQLGTLLDPIADKTFVFVALSAFLFDGEVSTRDYLIILSRDVATAIGFLVAYVTPGLDAGMFRARWSGKVVTALQLTALLALVVRPPLLSALMLPIAAASAWAIVDYTLLLARERQRQ
jgi:phosphatidylglycerophosphate synthase